MFSNLPFLININILFCLVDVLYVNRQCIQTDSEMAQTASDEVNPVPNLALQSIIRPALGAVSSKPFLCLFFFSFFFTTIYNVPNQLKYKL